MSVTLDIPLDLQPLITAAISHGRFENERELLTDILRVAVPALEDFEHLRRDVEVSTEMADRGDFHAADFDDVRRRLSREFDESGRRK